MRRGWKTVKVDPVLGSRCLRPAPCHRKHSASASIQVESSAAKISKDAHKTARIRSFPVLSLLIPYLLDRNIIMASPPASLIHLRTPPEPGKKSASRTYIIYFVTGNPGLVEYYRTFLTHLYGLLSQNTASDRDVEFQVYGRSLSGFEMNTKEIKTMKWRKQPPYGLQDQIRHAEDELTDLVEEVKEQSAKDVRVILVGHSVGAYISLEIIRRLRAHGLAGDDFETRVIGAIGLFPTIVDIARSESGMKAAVRPWIAFAGGTLLTT
jgi:pimeloyl-ACP methyl ester carboxylesterase